MNKYHEPVMLNKSIDALNVTHNGIYVDAYFWWWRSFKKNIRKIKEKENYMLLIKI